MGSYTAEAIAPPQVAEAANSRGLGDSVSSEIRGSVAASPGPLITVTVTGAADWTKFHPVSAARRCTFVFSSYEHGKDKR